MSERKLGRGLDALLGDAKPSEGETVVRLSLDQISAGRHQPRSEFDDAKLAELAASIKESGVLQPIIVRPAALGYEVVAGERRLRAARVAGLTEVPAIVRRYSDDEVLVLSLIENIQRQDLNAVDKALAYRKLANHLGATHEEVARRLGLDRSSVSNMIRLLDLPKEVQDLLRGGAITMGHARALLALRDEVAQLRLAERIVKEDLSVRVVESIVQGARPLLPPRRTMPRKSAQVAALEAELRAALGTKVSIQDRRGRGRIVVEYFSPEEFERLLGLLRGGDRGFSIP
jgi:ParB family chromosome partitioning protein